MPLTNCYADKRRAEAYGELGFPGTYYLAYRDLPAIFRAHVQGRRAVDFGCGTGRSTRFLKGLGFDVVGIDIAPEMLGQAREFDPLGDYRQIRDGDLSFLTRGTYDLVLSAFTFDNIPTMGKKVLIFQQLKDLLAGRGRIINLVSAPEIYTHEWASFSTRDFPENRSAELGDMVRIIQTDTDDARPVEDILWPDEAYREVYAKVGLECVGTYRPLGGKDEPFLWVNETVIAPWVIYGLKMSEERRPLQGSRD